MSKMSYTAILTVYIASNRCVHCLLLFSHKIKMCNRYSDLGAANTASTKIYIDLDLG